MTVQTLGTKPALLQAAAELTSFGVEGETDLFATDVGRALPQIQDPDTSAGFLGSAILAVNAPSAGVWMAVGVGAHGSPGCASPRPRSCGWCAGRSSTCSTTSLGAADSVRTCPSTTSSRRFCVITCVETYVRFVERDGRSPQPYTAFVARTIRETILAP